MECDLYEIWRRYEEPDVFFCLNGPMSQDLLVEICDTVARKMRLDNRDTNTIMKVHAAVVELSQNIIRYSAERAKDPIQPGDGNELGLGIIAIGCHNNRYTVTSGNLIDNGRVEPLRRLLERLKTMDREQLRRLFLEQRKSSPPDGSQGAGLGIIDISRKAGEPVEFEFRPVDDKVSFYCIKIVI